MSKKRVFDGDRTVLDIRKAEEREISDQLHKNLQFLNILYPRSYEFQSYYAQDMFIKPNTKAFPHVMHYLFNILDPNEFRKRFYWPLDRTSENAFRTNTVQYLNYINDKHNLGWGEIKAFLVVMPGGIKFMKLLLHLIDFIVDEEIKKAEKLMPPSLEKDKLMYTQENVEHFVRNYELFAQKSVAYKEKLELMKSMLIEKSKVLEEKLNDICENIGVALDQINEALFQKFAYSNYDLFESIITKKVNEIEETEKYLDKLSSQIDEFYDEKHKFPCDKNLLISSYNTINSDYPGVCPDTIMTPDNKIHLTSLFSAFNCIFASLENALGQCDVTKKRLEKYEFEVNEVSRLENEAMQLDGDIFKFENFVDEVKREVNDFSKSRDSDNSTNTPNRAHCSSRNSLKMKYIHTPAIYIDSNDMSIAKTRLALLEDSLDKSLSFSNQTILGVKSIPSMNTILGGGSGTNSKFGDPITLLRTVTKSNRKKQYRPNMPNLSMLATRFRENEEFFDNEVETLSKTVIESDIYPATPVSHKKVNRNLKHATSVDRRQAIKEKLIENSDITLSPDGVIFQKKPQAKSVQDVDMKTISKSPSGWLDPLVKIDCSEELSKIQINDSSMDVSNVFDTTRMEDITIKEIIKCKNSPEALEIEYDTKLPEFCLDFQKKLGFNSGKESIFNVSDSILKEVSE